MHFAPKNVIGGVGKCGCSKGIGDEGGFIDELGSLSPSPAAALLSVCSNSQRRLCSSIVDGTMQGLPSDTECSSQR